MNSDTTIDKQISYWLAIKAQADSAIKELQQQRKRTGVSTPDHLIQAANAIAKREQRIAMQQIKKPVAETTGKSSNKFK